MLRAAQLLRSLLPILITMVAQTVQFLRLALSSRTALSAEILFLRKQLAFYREHPISPRRLTAAARFSLLLWCRFLHWREALIIVKQRPSSAVSREVMQHGGRLNIEPTKPINRPGLGFASHTMPARHPQPAPECCRE